MWNPFWQRWVSPTENVTAFCSWYYDGQYKWHSKKKHPDTHCAQNVGFRLCTKCKFQKEWWVVWGSFHLTAIHLPHICLMSRRLQWRGAKYDVTHLKNSPDTRGAQIRPATCSRRLNFEHWILSMELAWCHSSGAQNLVVALRFLDNLCPPAVHSCQKDGCNEASPKFNRGQGATDLIPCNCGRVFHDV